LSIQISLIACLLLWLMQHDLKERLGWLVSCALIGICFRLVVFVWQCTQFVACLHAAFLRCWPGYRQVLMVRRMLLYVWPEAAARDSIRFRKGSMLVLALSAPFKPYWRIAFA
jgi:hypothetical protein